VSDYISPGVYVEEISNDNKSVVGVDTTITGMLGVTEKGRSEIYPVNSFQEYCNEYGGYIRDSYLTHAVEGFFLNGGTKCYIGRIKPLRGTELKAEDFIKDGLSGFCGIDEISIVYVPDAAILSESEAIILNSAIKDHCENMQNRFAILDIPKAQVRNIANVQKPIDSSYVAAYYPWLKINDPLSNQPITIPPGGHIAGIYTRVDNSQGVYKSPANEVIEGVLAPELNLLQQQQEILTTKMINPICQFPGRGIVVWGARTCSSDPGWKYINIRRLITYLEESIKESILWVVFEPNSAMLWSKVNQSISGFLNKIWRNGGLQGSKPEEAFFVKCDNEIMTPEDINSGRFILEIGVAPVRPAEFIIFRITSQIG
jgi:Bacteriophage tail sheath protein